MVKFCGTDYLLGITLNRSQTNKFHSCINLKVFVILEMKRGQPTKNIEHVTTHHYSPSMRVTNKDRNKNHIPKLFLFPLKKSQQGPSRCVTV